MDDRRKLRLPDGTVHNFADGALLPPTRNDETQRLWVAHVMREATSKGWRLFRHGGHTEDEASAAADALSAAGPALILIDPTYWVELEGEAFDVMVRSNPQTLNILISWLPRGCAVDPAPWESVHTPLEIPRRATALPSSMREVELLKLRLAFARRYGDLESMGLRPIDVVAALAEDVASHRSDMADDMADACRAAAKGMGRGASGEDLWGPHRAILGTHLVRMLILGHQAASIAKAMRMASETLESELRIALAQRN